MYLTRKCILKSPHKITINHAPPTPHIQKNKHKNTHKTEDTHFILKSTHIVTKA